MDKLSYSLTLEEINLVLSALSELPFKVSQPLIKNLVEQHEKLMQTMQLPVPEVLAE